MAYADLLDLRVELFPYAPFAARTWELRGNMICYDAWYIALAESLGSKVATLDLRLARAPGPLPAHPAALLARGEARCPGLGFPGPRVS
jgi:predicted nucleic acid-binding protein